MHHGRSNLRHAPLWQLTLCWQESRPLPASTASAGLVFAGRQFHGVFRNIDRRDELVASDGSLGRLRESMIKRKQNQQGNANMNGQRNGL